MFVCLCVCVYVCVCVHVWVFWEGRKKGVKFTQVPTCNIHCTTVGGLHMDATSTHTFGGNIYRMHHIEQAVVPALKKNHFEMASM